LTYGLEKIFETFYNAQVWKGISIAFDYQHVTDPGYNQVRGPVSVFSIRVHTEAGVPLSRIANTLRP
jgi:high affinity Mn2+ porin